MQNITIILQKNLGRSLLAFAPIFCALALITSPTFAAPHAAKVIYSFGDVKASGKSGSRGLKKGDMVYSGETVATTRGRAQIKFTDGGFASLQPNTDYQIDEYKYEGKADGNERSFLNLLKGSVRLVTGVIGKANRRNFRIKTAVATIGIRGTQGTLTHDPITNVTSLKGHGGEWELASGSFFGPVPAGQAYSCNGTSCSQIAGVPQRTEVGRGQGRSSRRQRGYQQGQQTAPDGRICDLGGACDDLTVELNQVAAIAATDDDETEGASGGTDFLEGLGVVSVNGNVVALAADTTTDGEPTAGFVTRDFDALRTAINSVEDVEDSNFATEANEFLNEIDSELLAELSANPAQTGEGDAGTTPDGLVTFQRWENGNVLIAEKNFTTGEVTQRIVTLEEFESVHIIYGDMLEQIPFSGTGVYGLTGGTYATAVDGSSMGMTPSAGQLEWNFGLGTGTVDLDVFFDNILFSINGSIKAPDTGDVTDPSVPSLFVEDSVFASYGGEGGMMSAYVTLDGFFTGENGNNAPLAAGLAYEVDYDPNPFVGTAAFGLSSQTDFAPATTIKYAFNYTDMAVVTPFSLANGDDQFPMGNPLSNFTTTFGDSFNQAGASLQESGTDPMTSVHWARFSTGYTFTSGALVSMEVLSEPFHVIRTDYTTPNEVITNTTGMVNYSLYSATSPTIIYDNSGLASDLNGTLTQANFLADFTAGTMTSISFQGNFPALASGTFTIASTGPVPINSGFANLTGTFSDTGATGSIGCMGGCPIPSGTVNYGFTSASAGGPPVGIISSFNANGSLPLEISGVAFSK
ncbi:MAG: FecR family protein [Pseudomonadota bacterium]